MITATELAKRGLFRDALAALKADARSRNDSEERAALTAEMLERTGDHVTAKGVADRLIATGNDERSKARALLVLGIIAHEAGEYRNALEYYTRASGIAEKARARTEACASKLRLLLLGGEASQLTRSVLADVRRQIIRFGELSESITLHVFVGQIETQQGRFDSARMHLAVAESLLQGHENVWLEGSIEICRTILAINTGELEDARRRGESALRCATTSGHAKTHAAALANLAHVDIAEDRLSSAERRLKAAQKTCQRWQRARVGIWDGLAQVELARGQYSECQEYLSQIEASAGPPGSWFMLWSRLTEASYAMRLKRYPDAIKILSAVKDLNAAVNDAHLGSLVGLMRADAYALSGTAENSARDLLGAMTAARDGVPLTILAEYHRVLGSCLNQSHDVAGARDAYTRAARIFHAIGHIRAERDVLHEAAAVTDAASAPPAPDAPLAVVVRVNGATTAAVALDSRPDVLVRQTAALMDQAGRPDLLGAELLDLARQSGCADALALISASDGARRVEAAHGWTANDALAGSRAEDPPAIALGSWNGRAWSLVGRAAPTVAARTTWMAMSALATSARALCEARREARERLALWPIDDPDDPSPGIFLNEQMTDLVRVARRIAASPVTVLLTGETGVGKEVFARIIHDASSRAGKTFTPFNCAAVPRDLMESQLFGHRRGAFTGADHASPGVIRATAGGTLFLDEIGEVPIDLQAKLLRFLEQGEIHPLGDPQPSRVDVRVIAATNRDLDQLVRDGAFRDDLYYRLNVIKLWIPPLRERREEIPRFVDEYLSRFAREQHKGQLRVSEDALEYLVFHTWPGNVRQLLNELRRLAALAERDAVVMPEHLSPDIVASRRTRPATERDLLPTEVVVRLDQPLAAAFAHVERAIIQHALAQNRNQLDPAARALGISRKGLYLKRRRLEHHPA